MEIIKLSSKYIKQCISILLVTIPLLAFGQTTDKVNPTIFQNEEITLTIPANYQHLNDKITDDSYESSESIAYTNKNFTKIFAIFKYTPKQIDFGNDIDLENNLIKGYFQGGLVLAGNSEIISDAFNSATKITLNGKDARQFIAKNKRGDVMIINAFTHNGTAYLISYSGDKDGDEKYGLSLLNQVNYEFL